MDILDAPKVSILMPVFDRKKFLPLIIENLKNVWYPKDKLEVVILDSWGKDGDVAEPLFKSEDEIKHYRRIIGMPIKYEYKAEALQIGKKRNMLVKMARHNYCINMDSDDIYFPHYVLYSMRTLVDNKKECCGSPQMLFLYPNDKFRITGIQCQAMRQIHEASMCYTKKHWKRMGGYASSSQGEGAGMVDGCNEKFFIKTEISKCMVCICHGDNTINKDKFNKDDILVKDVDLYRLPHIRVLCKILNLNLPEIEKQTTNQASNDD
jgi:glycosyltransferase involved in cell wall biosynthesis